MRASTLLAVLLGAGVAAQSQSFVVATSRRFSSVEDVQPSATETVSGPIQTGQACADVADLISDSSLRAPSVEAELAYACLKSVPIDADAANFTVNSIKQMVEFQSTLAYLKDPPEGYPNEPVDLLAGLDDIAAKVIDGTYTNEYDFENDIAKLFVKARDGHLSFIGMAYGGAFRWRRNVNIALISASRDGSAVPEVWSIVDFNGTQAGYEPSPITQINGQDVQQFLAAEASMNAYQDPDARYNALFFMSNAEAYGMFTSPRFYPGPTTNVTYGNGTTREYVNAAVILQRDTWSSISSPQDFYDVYIAPSTSGSGVKAKRRDPNSIPFHLDVPRDEVHGYNAIQRGSAPLYYPTPSVAHSADLVPLAGYFLDTDVGEVGVLVVGTFNTEDVAGAQEFQQVTEEFISSAQSRGVTRIIIDVRQNGGGKVMSGYDMYKQFFPDQEPQAQSRWRGHTASEIFGSSISSLSTLTTLNANLFVSPFHRSYFLSADEKPFSSWSDMYPPVEHNNDRFTALLKYNLSSPLVTSNTVLGSGITITGYGGRSSTNTTPPFRAEDIVILSDGICASTCALFVELMSFQSGVRSIALGGRPSAGPMAPVGGTKGTLVTPAEFLQSVAQVVVAQFAASTQQARQWARVVPNPFAVGYLDASVNFMDLIRVGGEDAGVPTQFRNDTADCRIWYRGGMYFNVSSLWDATAGVAWGGEGCVVGSVTAGAGNGTGGSGSGSGKGEEDGAVGVRVGWGLVVGVFAAVVLVW